MLEFGDIAYKPILWSPRLATYAKRNPSQFYQSQVDLLTSGQNSIYMIALSRERIRENIRETGKLILYNINISHSKTIEKAKKNHLFVVKTVVFMVREKITD